MLKKRFGIYSGVVVAVLAAVLTACSSKLSTAEIMMKQVQNVSSISDNVVKGYIGGNLVIGFDNTLQDFSIEVDSNKMPKGIEAAVEAGRLNIKSASAGKYTVPVMFAAKGREKTEINIELELLERPVKVTYPAPIKNIVEKNEDGRYGILAGTQDVAFEFTPDEGLELEYSITGDAFTMQSADRAAIVSANATGDATLTVKALKDGSEIYREDIGLYSFLPRLNGSFRYSADRDTDLEVGQRLTISSAFQEQGVAITADVVGMDITRDGLGIGLSTNTPGRYEVTVRGSLSGYSEYTESFVLNVTPVKAPLTVSHKQVRVVTGEVARVTLNKDTEMKIDIAASGPVKAVLNDNILSITGGNVGDASVKITASAEGYADRVIDIPVEVTNPPLSLSFTENSIITEYGKENSVGIVGYKAGDTVALSVVGDAKAQSKGESILVTLNSGDTATILVTVQRQGYTPWSNQIKLGAKGSGSDTAVDDIYQEVLNEVNAQRAAAGLGALVYRSDIEPFAAVRAKEISVHWDHTRPDGRTFNTVFMDNGKNYIKVGENLAKGSKTHLETPKQVVDAWMGSPGHRANILNPDFKGMAVSLYTENGIYYWAQMFIVD